MFHHLLTGMLQTPARRSSSDDLEELCGLVREFAQAAFITSRGLEGLAALLESMMRSARDPREFDDEIDRRFNRSRDGRSALDALIRAVEDERWDAPLVRVTRTDPGWRPAREELARRLRCARQRLPPR